MNTTSTEAVTLFIAGKPVAQPRHRQAVRGFDKRTKRHIITNYLPSDHAVHDWKRLVRVELALAFKERGLLPIDQAIGVDLAFVMPLAKSKRRKVNHRKWHEQKPDKDNLEKAVLDALSGIAWTDDAKVSCGMTTKVIAGDGDTPGVAIRIRSLPNGPTGWADKLYHVGETTPSFFEG